MSVDLLDFREVWLIDFEFAAPPGERPRPICMVALEAKSGRKLRLWQDDLLRFDAPPYAIDRDCLFVAYYASAEIGCHLSLGWRLPLTVLDLYVEFRDLTNGKQHYPKYSESPVIRPNLRLIAARRNGRQGGMRRAEFYSPEHLREWARLGGIATRTRHGNDFYRAIRKKRTYYFKGYLTQKTKDRLREQAIHQAKTEPNWAIAALWRGVAETWKR